MLTPPENLTDSQVADSLLSGWGIEADALAYAAVGFGSHHWRAVAGGQRWFLTVDDLEARRRSANESRAQALARLEAALGTAHALRDVGLDFVVAPAPTTTGDLISAINDQYVLAVYRHVEGEPGEWGAYVSRSDRLAVVDRLIAVHGAAGEIPALRDDLWLPSRDHLEHSLTQLSRRWDMGPFAEPCRELLMRHASELSGVLTRYDALVSLVAGRSDAMVVTHGEPHRGNVILADDGPQLIDWDTALLAPPERDLWSLIDEDETVRASYETGSGRSLDDDALNLYRLWWDLCEVCLYVADFSAPHVDTADARLGWASLQRYLDPARWH